MPALLSNQQQSLLAECLKSNLFTVKKAALQAEVFFSYAYCYTKRL
jgi:hypothetical protein